MAKWTWTRESFPYLMIGGLILAQVGYGISRYIPMTPEERQREQLIEFAEGMTRQYGIGPAEGLSEHSIRSQRQPPYRRPGQIVFVGGGLLVLLGLFAWSRLAATNR